MAGHTSTEIHLEIAHILFIDTVGYSKLPTKEQRQSQESLKNIVRASARFRAAESAGKLICLPTGDGMALVFTDSIESPVLCALEIAEAVQKEGAAPVRMGIHSGNVTRVRDVNDRSNIAGAAMNLAERIMSCADANQILLSKRAAEDLAEYERWRPCLHELGECEGKHGTRLQIVNFVTEDHGNPAIPAKFQQLAGTAAQSRSQGGRPQSSRWLLGLGLSVAALAALASYLWFHPGRREVAPVSPFIPPNALVSDKSIAVLPFENLSSDPGNSYFTDGVQDEILTDLAKVSDLKVISRTSTSQYRSDTRRNLRDIARALGVAYILEGSAQRDGHRVRVSAQLIDARTDTHVWAENYERDLADLFSLQSELAETIVAQLASKISPAEKAAIEKPSTSDPTAHAYYVHALALINAPLFNAQGIQNLFRAIELLDKAVAQDPTYHAAYCKLAYAHDLIYLAGPDHSPQRFALADAAVHAAQRLRPDAGETHFALAEHLYCSLAYDDARRELEIASRSLPNEPLVHQLAGFMDRRQGRWESSMKNLIRALELDPRNCYTLQQITVSYQLLRQYRDAAASLEQARRVLPNDPGLQVIEAGLPLQERADPIPLRNTIDRIVAQNPSAASGLADEWFVLALDQRDSAAADRVLAVMNPSGYNNETIVFPRSWCEALAARMRGDRAREQAAFRRAREEMAQKLADAPDDPRALCVLAMIDAALGQKAQALQEGHRAVDLLPISKDAINGPLVTEFLAVTYAWSGEKDAALQELQTVASVPSDVSYGQLRLHPFWDSLRGDPRFESIVAALAPPAADAP